MQVVQNFNEIFTGFPACHGEVLKEVVAAVFGGSSRNFTFVIGYEFKCFKSQAGDGVDLPSDRISDMFLDKDGNLICQIDNRVFLFDVKTCLYKTLIFLLSGESFILTGLYIKEKKLQGAVWTCQNF